MPIPRAPRRATAFILTAALVLLAACSGEHGSPRYAAEKKLFKARKMRDDLITGGMKTEFVGRTSDAYRGIVNEYGGAARTVPELEDIVISAQMELGELEYRGGLLREARGDFERALALAPNVPAARANALYSAGVISEELEEPDSASAYFTRFFDGFLGVDSIASTVRMNPRYLVTPLKLAGLSVGLGDQGKADRWLMEAERIYLQVIAREKDPGLVRETRYNLLSTYLQQKRWSTALAFAKEIEALYRNPQDLSSILYIEARIYQDGFGDPARALALYLSVAGSYPKEREAPDALLAAAKIHEKALRLDQAASLYGTVIDSFKSRASEVVEAQWQLAHIDELKGDFESASLRYHSIYTDYPETVQGFEAPLRIASNYREHGSADAARSACNRALEHYDGLASGDHPMATKIMAEEYSVRALVEDKRWDEAAQRLIALPDRYPDHPPFRENYLRAASIYEKNLGDRERAIATLETCSAKFPGTSLARAADQELARLKR
jgi:TolA-binding protein